MSCLWYSLSFVQKSSEAFSTGSYQLWTGPGWAGGVGMLQQNIDNSTTGWYHGISSIREV